MARKALAPMLGLCVCGAVMALTAQCVKPGIEQQEKLIEQTNEKLDHIDKSIQEREEFVSHQLN